MRAARLLAVLAILLAVGVARAPSAHTGGSASALSDSLEVSADGSHWSRQLDQSLFGTGERWVPGDSRIATFWVRGRADARTATLLVTLAEPDEERPVAARDLRLQARLGSGPWTPSSAPARLSLVGADALGDGRGQQVDVRASVEPQSGNVTMSQPIDLAFDVRLLRSDTGVVRTDSGRHLDGWLLLLAVAGGLVPLLVVVGRRRRQRGADHG